MKIYTVIGVQGDADTTTYGSFTSYAKADAEADRIYNELNAEFINDPELADDLAFVIWERGTVISILESELDLIPTPDNILTYTDVYDVIKDHDPKALHVLTEDQISYLRHINDFEPTKFTVINCNQIIITDGINGDVISDMMLNEFINEAIINAREEN